MNVNQKQAVTWLRFVYPVWAVVGMVGIQIVPSALIIAGDHAASGANISANLLLWNSGILAALVTQLLFVLAVLLLYLVFEPVDRMSSILMVVLALVSVPIAMVAPVGRAVAAGLAGSNPDLMQVFLGFDLEATIVAEIFWGLWLFPLGYLVGKSGYFPRILAYFLYAGGIGYVLGVLLHYLMPGENIITTICDVLVFGEVVFLLWLIVFGAKLPQKT